MSERPKPSPQDAPHEDRGPPTGSLEMSGFRAARLLAKFVLIVGAFVVVLGVLVAYLGSVSYQRCASANSVVNGVLATTCPTGARAMGFTVLGCGAGLAVFAALLGVVGRSSP